MVSYVIACCAVPVFNYLVELISLFEVVFNGTTNMFIPPFAIYFGMAPVVVHVEAAAKHSDEVRAA